MSLTDKSTNPLAWRLTVDECEELSAYLSDYLQGKPFLGESAERFSEARIVLMAAVISLVARLFWRRIAIDPPNYPTGLLVANWETPADETCDPPRKKSYTFMFNTLTQPSEWPEIK